ncbi:MAG TPA: phage tail protein [Candidatus Mediterraneibacter excrementigallinarum]|nr:phage tail protein [Candidatus Mediterraneibacter excrementigallinarum]
MYQVLIDGRDLFYPGDSEYSVLDATVNLQLNDSGTFECEVPVTNPEYGNIKNRISMIQVLKDDKEIFYGEVRESEKDFYGTNQVYAVGELAFLFDSIQPQAVYHDMTSRQLLETWLNIHNSQVEDKKKFYVGMVTVHDTNDSLYRYTNQENTLDCIREKLCEKLDGYLRIRKVDGKRYLDLVTLQEYGKICEQSIEFGENLLDYSENVSASDLYTCVIPKGARLEESPIEGLEAYVDITSVNDGKDYLYSEDAVATYGWNRCVVSFDDVTEPANLKKKGEDWLKDNQYETMVLELTAADLSSLGYDIESFELGDTIPVYSKPHGMDRTFPVQKLELHLQDPASDKLQLGSTMKLSYTEQNKGNLTIVHQQLENNRQTTAWLQAAIDNATAMMTGSRGGYKVSEYDEDGRWLRDLYMNAPNKEDATLVMQVNMNGIGFSRDGFDGPYKNAWTINGVLLGEFIKAGSVTAEKLSAEYKASVTDEIDTTVTSKFQVAENLISAEVTRATNQEIELAAALQITTDQINQKVSKGDVSSQLSMESDLITISGPRLKIDTDKFKVNYDGTTEIVDGYFHATGDEGSVAITQNMIFFTDSESTDAGKISFKRDQLSMCIGGYGPYGSCAIGYWGDNTHFNPIMKVTSGGNPAIQFNDAFSVIGKTGITRDVNYVRSDGKNAVMQVWAGIIVSDELA